MSSRWLWPCLVALAAVNPVVAGKPEALTPVPFPDVHIDDDFWGQRLRTNRLSTVEANLHQCEITGRIKNFAVAAGLEKGKHEGALYNDSDVYKVLEGVAYTLADKRDPDLEKRADAIIDLIAAAQQPDGYLDTYYTLVEPQNRWKNDQFSHELYCAGHLIEAAVAYQQATGKDKLLKVARKLADHIDSVFGPDKRHEASGHEEIELALIKLYRATKEERYLKLALFFLDQRGKADGRKLFGEYAQDDKPIREQTEVVGHAVRAMYLYCAMADAAAITGDDGLLTALDKIWHDVTERKMYLTGGIGPSAQQRGLHRPLRPAQRHGLLRNVRRRRHGPVEPPPVPDERRRQVRRRAGARGLQRPDFRRIAERRPLLLRQPARQHRRPSSRAVVRHVLLSDQHRPLHSRHGRARLRTKGRRRLDRPLHRQHGGADAAVRQGQAERGDEISLGRRRANHGRSGEELRVRSEPARAGLVRGRAGRDGQRREAVRPQGGEGLSANRPDLEVRRRGAAEPADAGASASTPTRTSRPTRAASRCNAARWFTAWKAWTTTARCATSSCRRTRS